MRYMTSLERDAMALGKAAGKVEGEAKGKVEGQLKMLMDLASLRFGNLPQWAEDRLKGATEADLLTWARRLFSAATLADVFSDAQAGHWAPVAAFRRHGQLLPLCAKLAEMWRWKRLLAIGEAIGGEYA